MKQSKIELVKFLKDGVEASNVYVDSIPRDIRTSVFDNTYSDIQDKMVNELVKAHFKTMATDVFWFLYEFTAGKTAGPHVSIDGVDYYFNTNEDYYKYLEAQ
jgi:hypothetical protein